MGERGLYKTELLVANFLRLARAYIGLLSARAVSYKAELLVANLFASF